MVLGVVSEGFEVWLERSATDIALIWDENAEFEVVVEWVVSSETGVWIAEVSTQATFQMFAFVLFSHMRSQALRCLKGLLTENTRELSRLFLCFTLLNLNYLNAFSSIIIINNHILFKKDLIWWHYEILWNSSRDHNIGRLLQFVQIKIVLEQPLSFAPVSRIVLLANRFHFLGYVL